MANMKKPPAVGSEGVAATSDGQGLDAFRELDGLHRWVTWRLVWNAQREKWDKIPHNGKHGLSTKNPAQWLPFDAVAELAERPDLSGVGLVMTGGIEEGQWKLIGLDFDGVDFEQFKLPFPTYCEKSPSGNGVRAFFWAPITWAARFRDTMDCRPPNCDHAEIYLGTTPRFLTVTFDVIDDRSIAHISGDGLTKIEKWGLNRIEVAKTLTLPEGIGTELNLKDFNLTIEQQQLAKGTGQLDRSAIMYGLIIRLIDSGAPIEDVLATIVKTPALWQYCLDHRHEDPVRALAFARDEVGRGYGRSITGMRANLLGFNQKPPPSKPPAIQFPPPFRGPMVDLVADALKAAIKPQPQLTMLAATIGMATALGSYWKLPGGGRLNLYGCGIAATGDGKDLPRCLSTLIAEQAIARIIGKPGSGQGLEDRLIPYTGMLCEVDEIAHFFAAVNNSRAPGYLIELAANLLRLFSASRTSYNTRPLKGKDEPKTIEHPALSLIGFATPEKLGKAVTVDNVADGLLGRFLFVLGQEDPPELSEWENTFSDLALRDTVKAKLRDIGKAWMTCWSADHAIQIGATAEAKQAFKDLMQEFRERGRATTSPHAKALLKRSNEKVNRLAGVLAAWDCPAVPIITLEHVQWAAQMIRASDAAVLSFMDEFVHGSDEQDNAAKLLKLMQRFLSGELRTSDDKARVFIEQGAVPRSLLFQRARLDKKLFDAAVAYLDDSDSIAQTCAPGKHANGRDETTRLLWLK